MLQIFILLIFLAILFKIFVRNFERDEQETADHDGKFLIILITRFFLNNLEFNMAFFYHKDLKVDKLLII